MNWLWLMTIKWKKRAASEYQKHITYCLHKFGHFAALRFLEKMDNQINLLKDFPHLGKVEPLLVGRRNEYRSLVVHPHFKLVYYINDTKGRIVVVHFWDVRREPQRLAEEIEKL